MRYLPDREFLLADLAELQLQNCMLLHILSPFFCQIVGNLLNQEETHDNKKFQGDKGDGLSIGQPAAFGRLKPMESPNDAQSDRGTLPNNFRQRFDGQSGLVAWMHGRPSGAQFRSGDLWVMSPTR